MLAADRYPEATFAATGFEPATDGGGTIAGTLTLAGRVPAAAAAGQPDRAGPLPRHRRPSCSPSYGIKPYSGFLGALKVRDAVEVEADVDLSAACRA